ncbi:phage tail tape measure protein [Bacteroides sp.]|uniref:phage tail tape measure protein n=1 Tax=Bacteroides sp. TaxID=29523 RepID=UPI002616F569|nr:phage tail tape measure protein [Bacteroides sp.]MDD3039579.1 phage tail tape measure protein [Bacteroides sp.]
MAEITQVVNVTPQITNLRKLRADINRVKAYAVDLKKQLEPGTRSGVSLTGDNLKSFMSATGKAKPEDIGSMRAAEQMKVQLKRFSALAGFEKEELALKDSLKKKEIDINAYRAKSATIEAKRRAAELKWTEEDANRKLRYRSEDLASERKAKTEQTKMLAQQQRTQERNQRNSIRAETNMRKAGLKQVAQYAKKQNDVIKNSFTAAFSLHIVQMYLNPFVRAVRMALVQTIQSFAEFDKVYANYLAKSTEFTTKVTEQQILLSSVGQTYTINDYAEAMERFSASGIDVAKNQKAVVDVLRTAKVANIQYSDAANGVIRTMEAFQMNISQSTEIVDAMANASNASTAELEDMVKWFEYAASSSFQAGLAVQDLAKYLGILSSTGMPGAGAAFRQMLLQFTKADIRDKFKAAFGFSEADFLDMNKIIQTLRDYVQQSENQAKASQEIVAMLGGKVTSQQALNNLIRAEPELWNRVDKAVQQSGSTQKLYADVTNNTASAIERITNNLTILKAEIGMAFGPLVKVIDILVTGFTKGMTKIPSVIKTYVLGSMLALLAVVTSVFTAYATLAGTIYAINGATALLTSQNMKAGVTFTGLKTAVLDLGSVMMGQATMQERMFAAQGKGILSVAQLNEMLAIMNNTIAEQARIVAEMDAIWAKSNLTFAQKQEQVAVLNAEYMANSKILQAQTRQVIASEEAKVAAMANTTRAATAQNSMLATSVASTKAKLAAGSMAMYGEMFALIAVMAAFSTASKAMEKGSFNLARSIYVLISAIAALKVALMIGGPWGALAGLAVFGAGSALGMGKVSRAENEYNVERRKSSATRLGAGQVYRQEIDNSVHINGMQITGPTAAKVTDVMTGATKYRVKS